jgi:ABC-2 type transport system permease protein
MFKALVVAKREYLATVGTKGFLIGLVLLPVLMFGGMYVPKLLKGTIDTADKRIVVLDGTGELFDVLSALAEDRNAREIFNRETGKQESSRYLLERGPAGPVTEEVRLDLSERVRNEELFAFIEISPDVLVAPAGEYRELPLHAQNPAAGDERRWFDKAIARSVLAQRLRRAGVEPATVAAAQLALRVEGMSLFERLPDGSVRPAERTDRMLSLFIPISIMMLMFMALMTSQYMLQSTIEEKQQRIAEVLLGSLNPFQLMLGKLLANVGVSLTMVGLYMLGGYVMASYHDAGHLVPTDLLGWFLVYQVLGVMLFGSIFAAVGAACSDIKDAQSLMMPVMLVIIFPMMIWFAILKEPNSNLAAWLSFIPTATPMLMLLRMALSTNVPFWHPLVGAVLVLATTLFCVWAAGRVFRIGILAQGKAPGLRELARWVWTG